MGEESRIRKYCQRIRDGLSEQVHSLGSRRSRSGQIRNLKPGIAWLSPLPGFLCQGMKWAFIKRSCFCAQGAGALPRLLRPFSPWGSQGSSETKRGLHLQKAEKTLVSSLPGTSARYRP